MENEYLKWSLPLTNFQNEYKLNVEASTDKSIYFRSGHWFDYNYILNQKRNFRKIGLRGGHTRYERKKKSTPTSNETSNEINDFQTVHEL